MINTCDNVSLRTKYSGKLLLVTQREYSEYQDDYRELLLFRNH